HAVGRRSSRSREHRAAGLRRAAGGQFEALVVAVRGRARIADDGDRPGTGLGAFAVDDGREAADRVQARLQTGRRQGLVDRDALVAVPEDAVGLARLEGNQLQRVAADARGRVGHGHQVRRAVGIEQVFRLLVGEAVEAVEGARIGARRQLADIGLDVVVVREALVDARADTRAFDRFY